MNQVPAKVLSNLPPTVVNTLSGRYAVYGSQWFAVNDSFTMQDAFDRWVKKSYVNVQTEPISNNWKVKNSKGNSHYEVSYINKQWNCNCVGFGFRRDCKHVQQIKQNKNEK